MDNKNKIEQVNNILSIVKLCVFCLFAGLIIYKEQFPICRNKDNVYDAPLLTGSIGMCNTYSVHIFSGPSGKIKALK